MVNGVIWRTRTGWPWRDLPAAYGTWQTVYGRHRRWSSEGTWEQMLHPLRTECDVDLTAEDGEWAVSIDSTIVRAHHDAAGARGAPPADVPAERLAVLAVLRAHAARAAGEDQLLAIGAQPLSGGPEQRGLPVGFNRRPPVCVKIYRVDERRRAEREWLSLALLSGHRRQRPGAPVGGY